MSAFIVSRLHIAFLVEATNEFDRGTFLNCEAMDRAGQMLWDENVKSVSYRYDGEDKATLPGPSDETEYVYGEHKRPHLDFNPVQVIKSAECYQYQSCEHDGWETSQAKHFTDRLIHMAIEHLPGYRDAVWGVPEEKQGPAPILITDLIKDIQKGKAAAKKLPSAVGNAMRTGGNLPRVAADGDKPQCGACARVGTNDTTPMAHSPGCPKRKGFVR